MRYGKKILSLLLAAVLAVGVLATGAFAGEIDTDTVDLGNVKFIGVYAQAEETLQLTYTDYESGETIKEEITATVYTLFNTADTVVYTHSAVSKFMPYRLQADGSYKQEGLGVQGGFKWTVKTFADRPAELYCLTPDRDAADVFFRVKDLTTGGGVKFSDVPDGAWYADTVKWAVEKGITTGTGATTFSPDTPCTTAEIITFFWRAAGSPVSGAALTYKDVPDDAWYRDAAVWACEKGLVEGGTFGGDTPCTRLSTVIYLWTLEGKPRHGSNHFQDVEINGPYHYPVGWAVAEEITTGTSDTTFSPDLVCSRAQIVTFLYRYMMR